MEEELHHDSHSIINIKISEPKLSIGRQSKTTSKLLLVICALVMLSAFPLLNLHSVLTTLNYFQTSSAKVSTATVATEKEGDAASGQCLGLDLSQEMDSLVARAHQIIITMPQKGGGTSMNTFTRQCSKRNEVMEFNFLAHDELRKEFLIDSLHVQPIISSHLHSDKGLIYLAKHKHPSQKTLMIYIHREESERVILGVKMISQYICKNPKEQYSKIVVAEIPRIASLTKGPW
jgi:hypothetical protein